MKSLKIGTLIFASAFALNSTAQVEKTKKEEKAKTENTERERLTPEQKATNQTNHMAKALELSDDQKTRVYEINLKVNEKNKAVMENDQLSAQFKKDSFKGNNDSRDYLIRELLTEEQKAKWDAMQTKRDEKREEMKENHDHEGHDHKH